jgi:hypothetical protein
VEELFWKWPTAQETNISGGGSTFRRMVKKANVLTRPAPARRDAPFHGVAAVSEEVNRIFLTRPPRAWGQALVSGRTVTL